MVLKLPPFLQKLFKKSKNMENYQVFKPPIGEGSFGKVYKGRRKHTGQIVALKYIPKKYNPLKIHSKLLGGRVRKTYRI